MVLGSITNNLTAENAKAAVPYAGGFALTTAVVSALLLKMGKSKTVSLSFGGLAGTAVDLAIYGVKSRCSLNAAEVFAKEAHEDDHGNLVVEVFNALPAERRQGISIGYAEGVTPGSQPDGGLEADYLVFKKNGQQSAILYEVWHTADDNQIKHLLEYHLLVASFQLKQGEEEEVLPPEAQAARHLFLKTLEMNDATLTAEQKATLVVQMSPESYRLGSFEMDGRAPRGDRMSNLPFAYLAREGALQVLQEVLTPPTGGDGSSDDDFD